MIGKKTKAVETFWQQCRREYGIATNDYHAYTLGDPRCLDPTVPTLDLSDHPRLILSRKKRGTAHLLRDFEISGVPLREAGDYWVILNYDNSPLCLVRITDVVVVLFRDVSESWAAVEGEGDGGLCWWRDAHRDYFMRQCALWGIPWREEYPTVCETWELVAAADR